MDSYPLGGGGVAACILHFFLDMTPTYLAVSHVDQVTCLVYKN